jgi:hypothetical protein
MRTIKTCSKGAPFYNASIRRNPPQAMDMPHLDNCQEIKFGRKQKNNYRVRRDPVKIAQVTRQDYVSG